MPAEVAEVIRRRGFFGHRKPAQNFATPKHSDDNSTAGEVLPFPTEAA